MIKSLKTDQKRHSHCYAYFTKHKRWLTYQKQWESGENKALNILDIGQGNLLSSNSILRQKYISKQQQQQKKSNTVVAYDI